VLRVFNQNTHHGERMSCFLAEILRAQLPTSLTTEQLDAQLPEHSPVKKMVIAYRLMFCLKPSGCKNAAGLAVLVRVAWVPYR
jgi:hypothetical protein